MFIKFKTKLIVNNQIIAFISRLCNVILLFCNLLKMIRYKLIKFAFITFYVALKAPPLRSFNLP